MLRERIRVTPTTSKFHSSSRGGGTTSRYPEGCGCCGEMGHFKRECSLNHLECRKCGIRGHLAKVCFQKGKPSGSVSGQSLRSDARHQNVRQHRFG